LGFFLGETAKGDYPLECVLTMANICKEAEAAVWQKQTFIDLSSAVKPPIEATHSAAIASVEASIKCDVRIILICNLKIVCTCFLGLTW